ncbi:MAG: lipoyl synthase [Candidatus Hydrogenedentales bacterium]|jgi:lipoic acid synthetase
MADTPKTRSSNTNKSDQGSKFPPWIRQAWPQPGAVDGVRDVLSELGLNTVCRSAHCPNQGECWSHRTATFMILGELCSRNCAFCNVSAGRPEELDLEEPERVAEAIARLGLGHGVITSVTRDDLPDGGAAQFAAVIRAIRRRCPGVTVEVLTPDFNGDRNALTQVLQAQPDVFAHNVETVERLHPLLRDRRASYGRSLAVLAQARKNLPGSSYVKSGLMVGCGEKEEEVFTTLADLRDSGCDAVTIGQYLKPRGGRAPITAFITPEQFACYEQKALELGFVFAIAGPFVRSSYHAEQLFDQSRNLASEKKS